MEMCSNVLLCHCLCLCLLFHAFLRGFDLFLLQVGPMEALLVQQKKRREDEKARQEKEAKEHEEKLAAQRAEREARARHRHGEDIGMYFVFLLFLVF